MRHTPVSPRELLVVQLWFVERRVRDWAFSPADDRDQRVLRRRAGRLRRRVSLFHLEHNEYPEIASAVCQLGRVREDWERIKKKRAVGVLCAKIARSTEVIGLADHAIAFAELAAWLQPWNPVYSNLAGRLNRNAGNWHRGDQYFERSVGLCIELFPSAGDRERRRAIRQAKARAFMGWGTLWRDLGNYARALRLYSRAASCARRGGVKWLASEVHHDMLVLASELGKFDQAASYAFRALEIYPVHNHRIPALGYDVALLFVRQQIYRPALELAREAVTKISSHQELLIVQALVARAAAGAGEIREFEDWAGQVDAAVRCGWQLKAAGALIHLTFAARSICDWERAERWAEEVVHVVKQRGLGGEERTLAEFLKQEIAARREEPPAGNATPLLMQVYERLLHILRAWRGPTWRRKVQAGPNERGQT